MRQHFKDLNTKLFKFFERYPLVFISLIIVISNWQLFFGLYGIKWDSSNYWHPWRYFISECYNNGIVPVWDPYTQSGYPVHGDLQGPAYSIEAIVTSFLFKGSVYSINLIYLGYLIFGSFGFLKLCNHIVAFSRFGNGEKINANKWPSIIAAIIYSLSGFTSSHGHNLYIVISVALLPWLYYYFFKILDSGTFYDSLKFAVIIFFQVTAGNPSFLIVSIYFMLATVIIYSAYSVKHKLIAELIKVYMKYLVAGVVAAVLCAPVLINVLLVFQDSTRAGGISLDWAGLEHSPISSVFSFVSPFTGYENYVDLNVRQPIISYYVGGFTLGLALIGFWHYKIKHIRFFVGFVVLAILISLGLNTPLFGWFHKYLPMFNVFRMPKLTFIYPVVLLLIGFVFGLHGILSGKLEFKKVARLTLLVYAPFVLIGVIYFLWFYSEGVESSKTVFGSVIDFFRSTTQSAKFLMALSVVLILVTVLLFCIKAGKRKLFFFVLLFDILFFYNITAIVRVYDEESLQVKEAYVQNLPKQFPVPIPISPLNAEYFSSQLRSFWMNTCIYLKQPGYTNNNSFALKSHAFLEDENKDEFQSCINLPFYTLIDSLATIAKPNDSIITRIAVVKKDVMQRGYKLVIDSSDKVVCNEFLPHQFKFNVTTKNKVAFLLQQTFNRYWKISVNGKEINPEIAYYNFPLVFLNPGSNQIVFSYELPYFKSFFLISLLSFVFLMFLIIASQQKFKWGFASAFLVLIVFCSYSFLSVPNKEPDFTKHNPHNSTINCPESYQTNQSNFKKINLGFTEDQAMLINELKSNSENEFNLLSVNNYCPPEFERWISAEYGGLSSENITSFGSIKTFNKALKTEKIIYTDSYISSSQLLYSEKMDAKNEFSGGIKFDLNNAGVKIGDLLVLEADVKTVMTDYIGLCFSIDNAGDNKKFGGAHSFKMTKDHLQHIVLYYTFKEKIEKNDELKAFLWNNKKLPVFLKRIDLKIIHKL